MAARWNCGKWRRKPEKYQPDLHVKQTKATM
jgi:hypothetical protein